MHRLKSCNVSWHSPCRSATLTLCKTKTDTVWSLLHWYYTVQKQTQGKSATLTQDRNRHSVKFATLTLHRTGTDTSLLQSHYTGQKQTQGKSAILTQHKTENSNRHRVKSATLTQHRTETLKQTQSEVCDTHTTQDRNRHRAKSLTYTGQKQIKCATFTLSHMDTLTTPWRLQTTSHILVTIFFLSQSHLHLVGVPLPLGPLQTKDHLFTTHSWCHFC